MFRNEDTKFKFAALKHDHIFIEWIDTTNPKKTTEHLRKSTGDLH